MKITKYFCDACGKEFSGGHELGIKLSAKRTTVEPENCIDGVEYFKCIICDDCANEIASCIRFKDCKIHRVESRPLQWFGKF